MGTHLNCIDNKEVKKKYMYTVCNLNREFLDCVLNRGRCSN